MTLAPKLMLLAVTVLAVPPALAEEHGAPPHATAKAGPSAEAALADLKEGNARFVAGRPNKGHQSLNRVKEVAKGQHPTAVILGCADSRVPPEVIFDQGIGDLFVVRVAGNIAEPATDGSIEYAAEHLGVPLVVVLGHHKCGAVKATAEAAGPVEGNIGALVREIRPAVEAAKAHPGKEGLVDTAVHENAARAAAQLTAGSPLLRHLVESGKVKIVTAVYDLEAGTIEWGR